jgi:exonuclease III
MTSRGPLRIIYHHNIRGINGKIKEFMIHLSKMTPDIICLTEHHLKEFEIEVTHLPNYKLGAKFCRKKMKNGGAFI